MLQPTAVRKFTLVAIFILSAAASLFAQTQNPSERPRNVSGEPKDAHKRWLNEDAKYIITAAERRAFLALRTDDERENFIAVFWRNRDPDPETEENEYREEYYQRMAYANEHFASGIPGWKTDRGRIYMTWGKPDSVESRPSGGSYDRPSYEGTGSITAYPFEIWFYRHLDGVGDGIEIEFVDRTGTGEYRIARDADEKDALATAGGSRSRGDRTGDISGSGYMREQDSPMSRALRISALETPPQVKFGDLARLAGSESAVVLDKDPIEFDLRIDFFRQSDERVITAFTVQTSNRELRFAEMGGLKQASMNIFGRITAVSGKRSGIFEDSVTTNATAAELAEARDRKSVYQRAVALPPGTYKVSVVVRDVGTGNKGLVNMGFVVPRYDDRKLSTSSLILASKLRTATERDTGQMFVIGNAKAVPNLSGIYKQGQEVGLYLQVYNAGIDQTTLRPAVDVEYILSRGGKEVFRQNENWDGLSDSGRRLTLARLLPTTILPAADYEIRVRIRDRVGGQVIENSGKFTITQ